MKILNNGTERASGLEGGMPGEAMEAPGPLILPCPMHLFHLATPEFHAFE